MQSRVIHCQHASQRLARKRYRNFMQLSHIQSSHEDHHLSLYGYNRNHNNNNCGPCSPIRSHSDGIGCFSSLDVRREIPVTIASKRQYNTTTIQKFVSTSSCSLGPQSRKQHFYFRLHPKTASSAAASFSSVAEDAEDDLDDELKKFADSTFANVIEDESIFFDPDDTSNKNDDISQNSVLFDIYQDDDDDETTKLENKQQQQNSSFIKPAEKHNMAQLLQRFDPKNPPNPENSSLHDLQLWYECESQRDAVMRYEKVIADARSREDYASLTAVQQQLLRWYHPLRQRIEDEQEAFIKGNSENKNNKDDTARKTDFHRYGPYLCMLQPEKLAYITSHEATLYALQKGGDSATLVAMAIRIGDAVEAEVNVQKYFRKQMVEQSKYKKMTQMDNLETPNDATNDHIVEQTDGIDEKVEDESNVSTYKEAINGWVYGLSHLQKFIDDMERNNPGKKTRHRVSTVNRRAQKLMESSEEWSNIEKVKLGVALIDMLSSTASLDFSQNKRKQYLTPAEGGIPAFTHEVRWIKQNQSVGHIVLNEQFYKMVVEDKIESLAAYTSRHQPMVVPPREWTGPKDGGYSALSVKLMRTHGCQIQQVSNIYLKQNGIIHTWVNFSFRFHEQIILS